VVLIDFGLFTERDLETCAGLLSSIAIELQHELHPDDTSEPVLNNPLRFTHYDVEGLISELFIGLDAMRHDSHFDQVLRFIDERVEDKLVTLKLYRSILYGEPVRDQTAPAHIALKLAGIVKRDRRGMLGVRNPIYGRLFTDEWAAQTAEADTKHQVEMAGWKKAAENHSRFPGLQCRGPYQEKAMASTQPPCLPYRRTALVPPYCSRDCRI
jgi:hypothetical protein